MGLGFCAGGAEFLTGRPGNGGVNRGRGDAAMIWGEESPGQTDQFEAKALPGAKFQDLQHTDVLGVRAVAPEVDPQAEGAGLTEVGTAQAKRAWQRRVAPRHREAIKQFFADSGSEESP